MTYIYVHLTCCLMDYSTAGLLSTGLLQRQGCIANQFYFIVKAFFFNIEKYIMGYIGPGNYLIIFRTPCLICYLCPSNFRASFEIKIKVI